MYCITCIADLIIFNSYSLLPLIIDILLYLFKPWIFTCIFLFCGYVFSWLQSALGKTSDRCMCKSGTFIVLTACCLSNLYVWEWHIAISRVKQMFRIFHLFYQFHASKKWESLESRLQKLFWILFKNPWILYLINKFALIFLCTCSTNI